MKDAHLPSLPGKAPKLQLAIDEGMFSQCSRSDIVAIGRTAATLNILLSHTSECADTTGLVKEKATARWPPDGTAHILCLMEQKHVLGGICCRVRITGNPYLEPMGCTEEHLDSVCHLLRSLQKGSALPQRLQQMSIFALKHLLRKSALTDLGVKTFKNTLLEAVEKRFSNIQLEPLYCLATILDPS